MSFSITVIIPTLNEAEILPQTLDILAGFPSVSVTVVDGGSSDATTEIASQAGVHLISGNSTNRATQLNRGAAQSDADILLFLHADTTLNKEAFTNLIDAFAADTELAAGGFARFFDSPSKVLKLTCLMSQWRSRNFGVFLGDQAMFVRREVFTELGGFDETFTIGEDLDFAVRLREKGYKTTCITPPILSSARRFQKRGPLLQSLIDLWLTMRIIQTR